MFFILLGIAVCISMFGVISFAFETSFFNILGKTLFIVSGLLFILLGSLVWYASTKPSSFVLAEETKLLAFQGNLYLVGKSHFLGIGSIDTKLKLTYLFEEDGYIRTGAIALTDEVLVKEIDGDLAYLKVYDKVVDDPFWNQFFCMCNCRYIFEVPKGSIRYDYMIDLK